MGKRGIKSPGLRIELALHLGLLLGAALLFSGVVLLKMSERELLEQKLSSLLELTRVQHLALETDLGQPYADHLSTRFASLFSLDSTDIASYALLTDKNSNTIDYFGSTGDQGVSQPELRRALLLDEPLVSISGQGGGLWDISTAEKTHLRFTRAIRVRNEIVGVLQLSYSLEGSWKGRSKTTRAILIYVLAYGGVLLAFGLYQLNRRVVRPLKKLMEFTDHVSRGELDRDFSVEGPREMGALSEAFNRMVRALRQSREETLKNIQSLQVANRELRQAQLEVLHVEKMASVGHLSAGLAHEIGNPLGALTGYLSLLKSELHNTPNQDLVGRSLAEAARIDRLIRELLDFAAPGDQQCSQVDPCQVLHEALVMLQQQGALRGIELHDHLPEVLGPVWINPQSLFQVFVNLLLNARDALVEPGTLELEGGADGDLIRISIRDSGCGMSEKELRHIFDPFFTTKPQGQGRGLGLTICHRIITEAKGRISVQSKPGEGTCFTLSFPLNRTTGCPR